MTTPQSTPDQATPQDIVPDGPFAYLAPKLFAGRFVDPVTGCWMWKGGKSRQGYGIVWIGYKKVRAHRLAAAIWLGLDLANWRSQACHNCPGGDNPLCFNPAHLFVGTNADNVADRGAKGRTASGARSNCTPLTDVDVAEIRRLRDLGMTCTAIARRFGIGQPAISRIVRGVRWPIR